MINGKECGRKRSWPVSRYYFGIRLQGERKTTEDLSQGSCYPGRDSNQE
jgi:hypothetical protein